MIVKGTRKILRVKILFANLFFFFFLLIVNDSQSVLRKSKLNYESHDLLLSEKKNGWEQKISVGSSNKIELFVTQTTTYLCKNFLRVQNDILRMSSMFSQHPVYFGYVGREALVHKVELSRTNDVINEWLNKMLSIALTTAEIFSN